MESILAYCMTRLTDDYGEMARLVEGHLVALERIMHWERLKVLLMCRKRVTLFHERVANLRECIKEVLDSDADMVAMYLTDSFLARQKGWLFVYRSPTRPPQLFENTHTNVHPHSPLDHDSTVLTRHLYICSSAFASLCRCAYLMVLRAHGWWSDSRGGTSACISVSALVCQPGRQGMLTAHFTCARPTMSISTDSLASLNYGGLRARFVTAKDRLVRSYSWAQMIHPRPRPGQWRSTRGTFRRGRAARKGLVPGRGDAGWTSTRRSN